MAKIHRYRIRGKNKEFLTVNLALMIKAGVPLGEALHSLSETSRSSQIKKALHQMEQEINEGSPLHRALEHAGVASAQTLTLVRFGEQSGTLVQNLQVAAKQEEKQRAFRANVRSALFYPTFVLTLTVIIALGIAWFLLPRLSETFTRLDLELPLISKILLGFGLFLKDNGVWFVPALIGSGIILAYIIFFAPGTKRIGQVILFHLPGIGRLLKEVELARMGYLLGTLLGAGLSITQSFELLSNATTMHRYKKFYRSLGASFEEGYAFRSSLTRYRGLKRLMPPAVSQMIITGERSGSLVDTFLMIGDVYEEKAKTSTKNLEASIEPLLLVIIAAAVLLVAIGVILPIYSLVGGLNQP